MEAQALPIYEAKGRIVSGLDRPRVVLVSAPTGSGKSTQIPQMVLDGGWAGDD